MNLFDSVLNEQPLPSWLEGRLLATLSAPHFLTQLSQTSAINDPHGTGGSRYALALAHALLCARPREVNAPHGKACGVCASCALLKAGNHPDLMCLVPEALQVGFIPEKEKKPSKTIKAEQLRALENNFVLSSQRGGRKVVIIYPAQTLGAVPANALLKTLEEPPNNTFFILVSEQWTQVMPTLRSRCVVQTLTAPSHADKIVWLESQQIAHPKRWLELADGRVDHAVAMSRDPLWMPLLKLMPYLLQGAQTDAIGLANDMSKAELKRVLEVLSLWMTDLLAVGQGAAARFFAAQTASMTALVPRIDTIQAAVFATHLTQMIKLAEHPLSARTQCEALLLEYQSLFDAPHTH